MGRMSRQKGATFERWVAKQLRPVYADARRQPQSQIKQMRELALVSGIDMDKLCLTDVVAGPWGIECKCCAGKYPAQKAWEQAARDVQNSGKAPVAIIKNTEAGARGVMVWWRPHYDTAHDGGPLVSMPLSEWLVEISRPRTLSF